MNGYGHRSCWIFVVLLFAWGACASTAVAQDYPSLSPSPDIERTGTNDAAVIVAVEKYDRLPNVAGAVETGEDWETFFRDALGVPDIHFLPDAYATEGQIRRFARMGAEDVESGGTLWFVFIGHGAPGEDGGDGLFVGADARQNVDSLHNRSVSQQEVIDILNEGPQAETVVVGDACFSGRDTRGEALVEAQPVVPVDATPEAEETPTTVLSAARADEFAGPLPGASRPAFSYLVLGALQGWAKGGEVTAGDVTDYAREKLRGIPGRFEQTPVVYGRADTVLARNVSEMDPGIDEVMRRMMRHEDIVEREEPTIDPEDVDCPDGRVATLDTDGNCCWPGQVWSSEQNECIGTPTECPEGHQADPQTEECVLPDCERGKTRPEGTTECCWPGQEWSSAQNRCVGRPAECPPGHRIAADGCERRLGNWVAVPPGRTFAYKRKDEEDSRGTYAGKGRLADPLLLHYPPVNQQQWAEVSGSSVGNCPDCSVTPNYFGAVAYLNELSTRDGFETCYELRGCRGGSCDHVDFAGLDCEGYRLPTSDEIAYVFGDGRDKEGEVTPWIHREDGREYRLDSDGVLTYSAQSDNRGRELIPVRTTDRDCTRESDFGASRCLDPGQRRSVPAEVGGSLLRGSLVTGLLTMAGGVGVTRLNQSSAVWGSFTGGFLASLNFWTASMPEALRDDTGGIIGANVLFTPLFGGIAAASAYRGREDGREDIVQWVAMGAMTVTFPFYNGLAIPPSSGPKYTIDHPIFNSSYLGGLAGGIAAAVPVLMIKDALPPAGPGQVPWEGYAAFGAGSVIGGIIGYQIEF